jgi:hypothetical protein
VGWRRVVGAPHDRSNRLFLNPFGVPEFTATVL